MRTMTFFYEIWQEFDPDGTQYMSYKNLLEFVDVLEPPLQICKPNKFKIIHMDIPIVRWTDPGSGEIKENMVFCTDILDALTQDFFARKGNPIDEPPHVDEIKMTTFTDRPGYLRVSSSLWKQREDYCASLIQKAWKFHKLRQTESHTEEPATGDEEEESSLCQTAGSLEKDSSVRLPPIHAESKNLIEVRAAGETAAATSSKEAKDSS